MNIDVIENHKKIYSKQSEEDRCAVKTLENWLSFGGKIVTNFAVDDKKPNIDGDFELVPDPDTARQPMHKFVVQIKGTDYPKINIDGTVKYQLKDLAFPAYVASEVTLDPSIIFLVLYPTERNKQRVFWKYVSPAFISSLDFRNNSKTIDFTSADEIYNSDESVDEFVKILKRIADNHSFLKQLDKREYTKDEIISIIIARCEQISLAIKAGTILNQTRDQISRMMFTALEDLCKGSLLVNSIDNNNVANLRTAWEIALTKLDTKFLSIFLQGLRYIGLRVPEEGQSERLMLKYYSFLWRIRKYMDEQFHLSVLPNLEDFPRVINEEDAEFNNLVAYSIESVTEEDQAITQNRYYIQKKTTFYVAHKRFFEYTLQLADKFATKYNRVTAYSKYDLSSNYSIQIGYTQASLHLWDQPTSIKIITSWRVSISPAALNKLSKIVRLDLRLSSRYNEYYALMNYLTETGISLLDLIDFRDERFEEQLSRIYSGAKTHLFREVLSLLHRRFSNSSVEFGKNTLRYAIISLREDLLDNIMPDSKYNEGINHSLYLSKGCYPFERNPLLHNLPKKKTNGRTTSRDALRAYGSANAAKHMPYVRLKNRIELTGELYQKKKDIEYLEKGQSISGFNEILTDWDIGKGCRISEEDEYVFIEEYVNNTVGILKNLLQYSQSGNEGQKQLNNRFLSAFDDTGIDPIKISALEKTFVDSHILVVYGAAGTGKTTLLNFISNLFEGRRKAFLTKTHAALDNVKKRVVEPGSGSLFDVIDHFIGSKESPSKYDIIFVDECSTIDNRTMSTFLKQINNETLLVCAGDIYQLESIEFGNWFFYAKEILPQKAVVELTGTWRTQEQSLKELWEDVRFLNPLITEKLVIDGPFSENIGRNLFDRFDDDEVVLCLNYDGKFGLNCINSYFQDANPMPEYYWAEWKYKVNDPVLFNDSKRFPMLYNNLKGTIADIERKRGSLYFSLDIPIVLTAIDVKNSELEIVSNKDETTRIRFGVFENEVNDSDEKYEEAQMRSVVPFQLAYAVSIHKAQGLEYNSVKVVIPNSNSERITHGVFYTAITRAKRRLKLFWSAETMTTVIKRLDNEKGGQESLGYIKKRLGMEWQL